MTSKPLSTVAVIEESGRVGHSVADSVSGDLKGKTARGALVCTIGQGANFVLRMGSMVVLARLLTPTDFGLVGMATACTGFLSLFRDCGLSMATVQRTSVTRIQTSTLFWVNLAAGGALVAICTVMAPILAAFYHEPRLFWVTVVIGACFLFNGGAAQHRAVLTREMRFAILTLIDVASLVLSIVVGVGMAAAGQGYWALVGMTVSTPLLITVGVWLVGGWIPKPPRFGVEVQSMLRFGSVVTLNGVMVYLASNADKVLLGRFWGAEALGVYGRAFQLMNVPTENLSSTIGGVAIPALSRLQNDPQRLRSYFLKGYALLVSLLMPITMASALFVEDFVRILLGPKWDAAAPLCRLLAPTMLALSLINPVGWLMLATGRAARSLKIASVSAPIVILGYLAGLSYGPSGVAAGFSIAAVLLVVPVIFWATRGTSITALDTIAVVVRPGLAILIAAGATLVAGNWVRVLDWPLLRLIVSNTILFGLYGVVLLFMMGQRDLYLGLIRELGIFRFCRRTKTTMDAGLAEPQVSEQ